MMLHATARWPQAMSPHLWPYAMQMAKDVMNAVPTRKDSKSAIQVFSSTVDKTRLQHFHPLGCPVYVLQNLLQAGQQISKWHKQACLGLYLGHLPSHARSVALVLNLSTGLVSPQFHMKFNKFFEMVNKNDNKYPNQWRSLTHLTRENNPETSLMRKSESLSPITQLQMYELNPQWIHQYHLIAWTSLQGL